jgi:SnoaL-like protein
MPNWRARFIVFITIWMVAVTFSRAYGETPTAADLHSGGKLSMSEETSQRDLFDRWERVWHEGQYDLISSCIGPTYVRHEAGDRTVAREAYAAEIAKMRQERPHLRFVVYDQSFEGNRAWFRFTLKWTDSNSGESRTRAGMQVYRVEGGKLAETWLQFQPLASAWPDAVAQEHWTSPPPMK